METTFTAHPERLIELLTEQRELYGQLGSLSDRQRSLISGDRPETLLNILQHRQTLVAQLAQVNEQLAPYRRNWDALYAALPAAQRERVAGLLREVNGLLAGILKSDEEDARLLVARKQAVAQSLSSLAGTRVAQSAYARQAGRG